MSSEPPTPPPVSVKPLPCPKCGSAIPLGEGETAKCPYCQATVAVPDEYRALRATHQQDQATRHDAAAAFAQLGAPPGLLMRAWAQSAGVAGGLLGVLVAGIAYVGGTLAFLSIFLLEFVAHWLARPLHLDLADYYGGFGLYFRFALVVVVGVALPVVLGSSYDAFAKVRGQLQAGLAARLPTQAGGPSLCRSCGAPLDVPAGALGVTCLYCSSDNLVAFAPAWVKRLEGLVKGQQQRVESAVKELVAARESLRSDLQMVAIVGVVGVPLFGLVGKIATAIDYDVVPPTWAALVDPHRHLVIEAKPVAPDEPFTFQRFWGGDVFTALHAGEVLVVHTADAAKLEGGVRSNTTFPVGEWGVTLEPQSVPTGATVMEFKAPYQGVFRVHVAAWCARVDACVLHFSWRDTPVAVGRPAPPTLTRREWSAQDGGVQGVAWSPDGRLLATAGANHQAVVWDAVTLTPTATLRGHTGVIQALAFSPDGRALGTASVDQTARIWNVDGGTPVVTLKHPDAVETLAWRPDGTVLATAGKGGTVHLWDVGEGFTSYPARKAHQNTVMALAWSADGTLLASGGFDHRLIVWDVEANQQRLRLDGEATTFSMLFLPQRLTLVTAEQGPGSLWELAEGRRGGSEPVAQSGYRGPMVGHSGAAYSITATPDGRVLATGSADQTVRVWDPVNGREKYLLGPLGDEVNAVAFRPDGLALAAGLRDGRVILWETTSGW
jgi:DNA-directed RNA polymerase subunit RPC12/RpoP